MEKSILDIIKERRSVRSYRSDKVPEELLDAILEAGTYAPTGGGRQSPVIVAITETSLRRKIAELNAEVRGIDTDPYYGAPVAVLVLADKEASTCVEDGSCVLENMMLAAKALGIDSVWVHNEKELFETKKGRELLKEWGLSENLRGIGAIALGYRKGELGDAAPRKENYIIKK